MKLLNGQKPGPVWLENYRQRLIIINELDLQYITTYNIISHVISEFNVMLTVYHICPQTIQNMVVVTLLTWNWLILTFNPSIEMMLPLIWK